VAEIKKSSKKKVAKRTATTTHKHRVIATPKKGASVDDMMTRLAQAQDDAGSSDKKAKNDKPVVTLANKASDLLWLIQAKKDYKTLEGKIQNAETMLFEDAERQRLEICEQRQSYIGSVNLRATGKDENQNPINTGLFTYYRQYRHSAHDDYAKSKDDELQAAYDGKATARNEVVNIIAETLNADGEELSYEEAEAIYLERVECENSITITSDTLAEHPEIFDLLEQHGLLQFITRVSKTKPTKQFYERSQWHPRERAIMDAIQAAGFFKQAKPTLRD